MEAPIANSDHNSISARAIQESIIKVSIVKPLYDLRKTNVQRFLHAIASVDWTPFYRCNTDIDSKCDVFHETLDTLLQAYIPRRLVTITDSDKPWITPLVKFAIQKRWDAYREKNFCSYHHWKSKSKSLIASAKENWSSKAGQTATGMWRVVNTTLGNKSSNPIFRITKDFASVAEAAKKINETLASVFTSKMTTSTFQFDAPSMAQSKWDLHITSKLVEEHLRKLNRNKSMVPTILYKEAAAWLSPPLAHLFNLSLQEQRFPKRWKLAHICPIPKTRPPTIDNLRPIALLPLPSKIFERIILKLLKSQFTASFGPEQYGARPHSSTTCAIISLLHFAFSTLEQSSVSGIQLVAYDYSKAFDILPHDLILRQLQAQNFPLEFVKWTADYLHDRHQAVRIGAIASNYLPATSGVPQGSVLGPLLFCLSVAGLKSMYQFTKLIKYVDDVTLCIPLYKSSDNNHVVREHDHFLRWSSQSGFSVNLKKCKSLFFRKSKVQSAIHLDKVTPVQSLKLLGMILNDSLTWNDHICNVTSIASKRMYALRILKPILPKHSLKMVYNALIRSILEYGSPAFGDLPRGLNEKLDKIQKRCHSLICGKQCICDTFDSLEDRRKVASVKLFIKSARSPDHILYYIIPAPSRQRSTRYIQPHALTSRFLNSFIPHTTILINEQQNRH